MFAVVTDTTVLPASDRHGGWMCIAYSEIGFWLEAFRFRVFPDAEFVPKTGDRLQNKQRVALSRF